jgi:hypothetical protein
MAISPSRLKRLRMIAFYPRRYFAWCVEVDGQTVAWLVDPEWDDMFWTSYRVVPAGTDDAWRAKVLTEDFWRNTNPVIRYRENGWVHPTTFPGGMFGRDERGRLRVSMRSLMFAPPSATVCDRWVIRMWRKRRLSRKAQGRNPVEST